ncbi:hypothetical protein [Asticcacaulis sp. MM231]|uniref:phosphoribosyltransferase-like protein n=1 Tax=Asticcacaulis sp. MM231 TaxID=3157666 RepID=UPI0032D57051
MMLVTDFIGSGHRAKTYLEAAWKVGSVKSWWSARRTKGLTFEVVAYSATPEGQQIVQAHPSGPVVSIVSACPTIATKFGRTNALRIKKLCVKMDPVRPDWNASMGYAGGGALIAFAHGIPNNAPRLLYKRGKPSKGWIPLFPQRITSETREQWDDDDSNVDAIRLQLENMRQLRLSAGDWLTTASPEARVIFTVMAALSTPPRNDEHLSRKTGLAIAEVQSAISSALANGWIDGARHLTDTGYGELNRARQSSTTKQISFLVQEHLYHPRSLRAPIGTSS